MWPFTSRASPSKGSAVPASDAQEPGTPQANGYCKSPGTNARIKQNGKRGQVVQAGKVPVGKTPPRSGIPAEACSIMSFSQMDHVKVVDPYVAGQEQDPKRGRRVHKQKRNPGTHPPEAERKQDPPKKGLLSEGGPLTAYADLTKPIIATQNMIDLYDIASWKYTVPTPDPTKEHISLARTYTTENTPLSMGVSWNGIARLVIGIPMITGAGSDLFGDDTVRKIERFFVSVSPIVLSVSTAKATTQDLQEIRSPLIQIQGATNTTTLLVGEELKAEVEAITGGSDTALKTAFTDAITAVDYTPAKAFVPQHQDALGDQYSGTYAAMYPTNRCEPIEEAMYYASGDLTQIYSGGAMKDNEAVSAMTNGCLGIVLINVSEDLIAKHYLELGIASDGTVQVNKAVLNMSVSVVVTAELGAEP